MQTDQQEVPQDGFGLPEETSVCLAQLYGASCRAAGGFELSSNCTLLRGGFLTIIPIGIPT